MTKAKDKTAALPRFDLGALRETVGDKVLARGEAYCADGRVEILAVARNQVRARVAGTEVYRTELTGSGRRFSGECTCPAFERENFCKHLVATALTVNAMDAGTADAVRDRFARMREHLRAKGTDALVEIVMKIAERDSDLRRQLELAVAAHGKDDETLFASFKSAITEATRTSGYMEYSQTRAWAANIEAVLKPLDRLIGKERAPVVLRLLDHFFARMDRALQNIDDQDGHGDGLLMLASEMHFQACCASSPEPVALARDLFRREIEWEGDCFCEASEIYRTLLGKAGLAEYHRLAREAWAEIKPLHGGTRRVRDDEPEKRYRLKSILESFAERDGDIDAWIAIRAADLSSAYAYLQVAKLCAEHGRLTEALKWADEGLWQFEDEPDKRLVTFTAALRRRMPNADIPAKAATPPLAVPARTRNRRKANGAEKGLSS